MSTIYHTIPSKIPFADFDFILTRHPKCFILSERMYEFPVLRDMVRKYDDYVDKLYMLAAEGEEWDEYFGSDAIVFREFFKETSKRLDSIKTDNLKKNKLHETIVKIKH